MGVTEQAMPRQEQEKNEKRDRCSEANHISLLSYFETRYASTVMCSERLEDARELSFVNYSQFSFVTVSKDAHLAIKKERNFKNQAWHGASEISLSQET